MSNRADQPAWREVAAPHLTGEAIPEGVRNITLTSLAGRLRREGYGRDVIEPALLEINRRRCVPPMSPRAVRGIARWIDKKPAGAARDMVAKREFEAARDAILDLAVGVEAYPWHGHGAATDRDVVRALVRIGYDCGRLTFEASVRRIAECAEVGRPAVRRALTKRKAVRKWVRCVRRGRGPDQASTWRLRLAKCHGQSDPNNAALAALRILGPVCPTPDVWRYRGLGKSACHVWNVLAVQPPWPSVSELARACKMLRKTVDRALARLAEYGLAVRDEDGWRRGATDPIDVAPRLQSYGAAERQRQQHEDEREEYRENRARRARRRGRLLVLRPTDGVWDTPPLGMAA